MKDPVESLVDKLVNLFAYQNDGFEEEDDVYFVGGVTSYLKEGRQPHPLYVGACCTIRRKGDMVEGDPFKGHYFFVQSLPSRGGQPLVLEDIHRPGSRLVVRDPSAYIVRLLSRNEFDFDNVEVSPRKTFDTPSPNKKRERERQLRREALGLQPLLSTPAPLKKGASNGKVRKAVANVAA